MQIGNQHLDHLENAVRDQVFKCIKDNLGRCLSEDDFAMYVDQEEQPEKPRYKLEGNAKEALRDYYDAVHTLSKAQTNFAASAKVLEQKIEDKSVFLDIIKQVQLPASKCRLEPSRKRKSYKARRTEK